MAPPNSINRNIPSPFQLSGVTEKISYRFYDTLTIATGATSPQLAFAAAATADNLGNFEGNGAMPAGQGFYARAIRIFTNPAARFDDAQALLNATVVTFTKENAKKYAMGPTYMFPAGMGAVVETGLAAAVPAAPANSIAYLTNGVPVMGNCYRFELPVLLFPQQQFKISLTPFNPTLSASVTVRVILEGVLERNLI